MEEVLTLKDVAKVMKCSLSTVYHNWNEWEEKGLRILKSGVNGHPRFYRDDILEFMESGYKKEVRKNGKR
jgi:excisionase family DNA binding protein